MKNLIEKIFKKEDKCEDLKKENAELRAKLAEKQEHINKTNAYYKKKIHQLKIRKEN